VVVVGLVVMVQHHLLEGLMEGMAVVVAAAVKLLEAQVIRQAHLQVRETMVDQEQLVVLN
jgi:hypothetical protein